MSANEKQHGGNHYQKLGIQHWDYVVANDIPYLEACAIKYLTRWRDKGGILDLEKAKHYVEKLIEVEKAKLKGDNDDGQRVQPVSVTNGSRPVADIGTSIETRTSCNEAG